MNSKSDVARSLRIGPLALYFPTPAALASSLIPLLYGLGSADGAVRKVAAISGVLVLVVVIVVFIATLRRRPQLDLDEAGVRLQLPLKSQSLRWDEVASIESRGTTRFNSRLRIHPHQGAPLDIHGQWFPDYETVFADITARSTVNMVADTTRESR